MKKVPDVADVQKDELNQLHSYTQMALRFVDGWGLYYVHGQHVPDEFITKAHEITPETIDKETNLTLRRILLELFGREGQKGKLTNETDFLRLGTIRYVKESKNVEILDEDIDSLGQPRKLFRKQLEGDETLLVVWVKNSTPTPEGVIEDYLMLCHPECRPLINPPHKNTKGEIIPAKYGDPQKLTCQNAVASTFGETGEEYGKNGSFRQGDVYIKCVDGSLNSKFLET